MNIVFAADSLYLPHLAVALSSLYACNPDAVFSVYIINSDIGAAQWRALVELDREQKHKLINARINGDELDRVVLTRWFSKASYYRLFIPDLVPGDRAVYVDCDVLFKGEIGELWGIDLDQTFLAAVQDAQVFVRAEELEMSGSSKYFNAGVMVLNLDLWREHHLKKRVIAFVERKPEAIQYVEQCGLNAIVNGRWTELHPKFNMQTHLYRVVSGQATTAIDRNAVVDAIKAPVIVHFTETPKPLELASSHPWKQDYWSYLQQTAFARRFPSNISLIGLIARCFPSISHKLAYVEGVAKRHGMRSAFSLILGAGKKRIRQFRGD